MADFITLTCPTCGGQLQITPDLDRFACAHCGKEHIVKRGGGVISLAPVVAGLTRIQAGVDKTASELALTRLRSELQALQIERDKAIAKTSKGGNWVTDICAACGLVLLFAGIALRDQGWVPVLAYWALGAAIFVVSRVIFTRVRAKQRRLTVEPIEQLIEKRRDEWRRHKEIVSS